MRKSQLKNLWKKGSESLTLTRHIQGKGDIEKLSNLPNEFFSLNGRRTGKGTDCRGTNIALSYEV